MDKIPGVVHFAGTTTEHQKEQLIVKKKFDEAAWIRLYMELTGANESQARSVYMHVYVEKNDEIGPGSGNSSPVKSDDSNKPKSQSES